MSYGGMDMHDSSLCVYIRGTLPPRARRDLAGRTLESRGTEGASRRALPGKVDLNRRYVDGGRCEKLLDLHGSTGDSKLNLNCQSQGTAKTTAVC